MQTFQQNSAYMWSMVCTADEFVRRAGLGNAAGLLKIKGLFGPLETKHVYEAPGVEQEKH
eukprot:49885-Eustigmatos_ZCMA.PRE.1